MRKYENLTKAELIERIQALEQNSVRHTPEESRGQSEAQFRVLFGLTSVGMIQIDPSTCCFLRVNDSFVRMIGYTAPELLDKTFLDIIHPDDRQSNWAGFTRLVEGRAGTFSMENRQMRKDGAILWCHVGANLVCDVEGRPLGVVAVIHDITDHKRVEQALRERERFLRLVIDTVPHYIFAKNRDGRFLLANRFTAEQSGYPSPEAMVDLHVIESSPSKTEAERFLRNDQQVIASGQTHFIPEEPVTDCLGRTRIVQTTKIPFPIPGANELAVLGVAIDITERKQAEAALRASEERLQLALRASGMGTFEIDLASGKGEWNAVEFELLGLRPGDAPAGPETFFRFVHPDDMERLRTQWEEALRSGELDTEFRIIRADGEERWLVGKGRLAHADETEQAAPMAGKWSPRFLGVNFDITERKNLEQEVLAISERERRNIGHDLHDGLGQQLTALEMKCFLLIEDLALEDFAARRGQLQEEARQISEALRECITHTRSLAHGLAPVNLQADGLMEAINQLAHHTHLPGKVECHFSCTAPVTLHDALAAGHLYRIAQEAVNNALKHARMRRIDISLAHDQGWLRLQIKDDGRGLPEKKKPKSGMGLEVMRHRAHVIGASLEIDSQSGQGVSVTCTLPLKNHEH